MFDEIHIYCYNAPDMMKERRVTEQNIILKEWLGSRGIKAVLFDLDDTLLDSHALYSGKISEFKAFLHASVPDVSPEELDRAVDEADMTVFGTHSVSNERWGGLVTLVCAKYRLPPETYREGLGILLSIYEQSPGLFPKALETLQFFRQSTARLGLVTHANREYTELKLRETGLGEMFDHVEIADEWGNKNSGHWQKAIATLGVQPQEVLVIGDSIQGDMRAAREAGVVHLVHLPSPWEPYQRGDMPEGVIEASGIHTVIDTLIAHT